MSGITTHVLDTSKGSPASGVRITLEARDAGGNWSTKGSGTTDADGRVDQLLPPGSAAGKGTYRMRFETGEYFAKTGAKTFYPFVDVTFEVSDDRHHHVPLLISPWGYSTYRGS